MFKCFLFISVEYFRITLYDPEEGTSDDGYIRSTEDAIYEYNPEGDEILIFQSGTTGTTWYNLHEEDGEGLRYYFYEIVDDNATVTFLFGHETLTGGYKYRNTHSCTDLDQTDCILEDTVDWIVPGVGWVKADVLCERHARLLRALPRSGQVLDRRRCAGRPLPRARQYVGHGAHHPVGGQPGHAAQVQRARLELARTALDRHLQLDFTVIIGIGPGLMRRTKDRHRRDTEYAAVVPRSSVVADQ